MPFSKSFTFGRIVLGAVFLATIFANNIAQASIYKDSKGLDPKFSAAEYMACLDNNKVTLVSAHRGGIHPGFPENALESMQAAVAYGPILLEVDVRETADGHLVLLHDNTLERTTNMVGNLSDYTLSELSRVRLKDHEGALTAFSIPTLEKVLSWAKDRAIVQLDVKRGVDFAKVAQAVVDADAVDSTLMIAYELEDAVTALKIHKGISFSLMVNGVEDLDALDAAGIPRDRVVAWTGVVDQFKSQTWESLDNLGIPASAGAIWALEKKIMVSGNPQPYIELANAGVDVIAADHYRLAFDTLASQQDLDAALTACRGQ